MYKPAETLNPKPSPVSHQGMNETAETLNPPVSHQGMYETAALLIDNAANLEAVGELGNRPLHLAASADQTQVKLISLR